MKSKKKINEEYKHYVYKEIGLVKGYKVTNETNESDSIIINDIKIEINMTSETGRELYHALQGKFEPEKLSSKYVTQANYIYSERENDGIITIYIKVLTNRAKPEEIKAKKKLLHKINKYV